MPQIICIIHYYITIQFQTLTVSVRGMYGGTIREDPEYPGILSIPDTVSVSGMNGGTTREDPEYPGILSIPDTVCEVVCMGDKSGGSRVSRDT